jgi:hypothetical protein
MEEKSNALSGAIDTAIAHAIERLNSADLKLNIGELTKLLELQKELKRDEVRFVTVTWIEMEQEPTLRIEE